ncbi:MAG: tripartite tricarboxylate transporter substrate-binding protein [Betaproteobacteria bacterium]|nr:tripartite tricarboxylate transporter substrate-binding protein [Betaproteobacteria bacterium]
MKAMRLMAAFAAGALLSLSAAAQTWPQKPVRFIVPFPPGGATDISARLLGQKLNEMWGQSVVIENRGGAGGGVGAAEAAKMTPDGYNFFFPSGSVVTANQHIYAKLNYDPEKDFVPVTNVVSGPQVLVVPANSPYKTLDELLAAVRANPGKFTFGHAGIGSQIHLAAENFVYQAKLDAISVPYKGEGPALAGLIGGETTFMLPNMAAAIGHVNGGRVRALGVTSADEAPQMPGVPPIGRTVRGFVNSGWFGIVAPTGTPPEIIARLHADVKKALDATEMRARFYAMGLSPVGNTPAEMAKALQEETKLWAVVVRERKISVK